jgi:hypothetical protein
VVVVLLLLQLGCGLVLVSWLLLPPPLLLLAMLGGVRLAVSLMMLQVTLLVLLMVTWAVWGSAGMSTRQDLPVLQLLALLRVRLGTHPEA